MEFFQFCLEIIKRESERFNVGVNALTASQLTAANADGVSYDNAHNRCAFIYRCGTINLSFGKDCFSKFLSDYNGMKYLLTKWKFSSCLTFCSLSKGPAFDYIALLLSHEQSRIFTSLIGNIKIITKYGAWRNTANIMLDIINKGYFNSLPPSIGNMEVIQGDPFNDFSQKVKLPINDSDIVMMIKTLNLQSDGYDQDKISKNIQEFLDAVKPGAVLFCIDTKPSIKEITQLLITFPGKYLLEPTYMSTLISLESTDLYKACFGCSPVVSGRGCFFVWEKSVISTPKMKCELNEISESVNITEEKCDKVVVNGSSIKLTKESNSYDQQLAKYFNHSTPKLSEENSISSTFDCGNKDLQFADNVNYCFENSINSLSPDSLINTTSIPLSDHCQKESLNTSLSSLRSQLDVISNNICIQTESEEFLQRIEFNKITELTNKITNLTTELTKLFENDASKYCASDSCSRNSEEICNSPDPEMDSQNHCSSVISCSRFSQCSQNIKTYCCRQICMCSQSLLSSRHDKHNAQSLLSSQHDKNNACISRKVSDYCCPSNPVKSIFLAENASPSAPQLVIPLNSLSANVVSQIISLITQSNSDN